MASAGMPRMSRIDHRGSLHGLRSRLLRRNAPNAGVGCHARERGGERTRNTHLSVSTRNFLGRISEFTNMYTYQHPASTAYIMCAMSHVLMSPLAGILCVCRACVTCVYSR